MEVLVIFPECFMDIWASGKLMSLAESTTMPVYNFWALSTFANKMEIMKNRNRTGTRWFADKMCEIQK